MIDVLRKTVDSAAWVNPVDEYGLSVLTFTDGSVLNIEPEMIVKISSEQIEEGLVGTQLEVISRPGTEATEHPVTHELHNVKMIRMPRE